MSSPAEQFAAISQDFYSEICLQLKAEGYRHNPITNRWEHTNTDKPQVEIIWDFDRNKPERGPYLRSKQISRIGDYTFPSSEYVPITETRSRHRSITGTTPDPYQSSTTTTLQKLTQYFTSNSSEG